MRSAHSSGPSTDVSTSRSHIDRRRAAGAPTRQCWVPSDRHYKAVCLSDLGETHDDAGDRDTALDAWQHALTILDELHHPDAAQIHTKLTTRTAAAGNRSA
jgi:hypothetical protein